MIRGWILLILFLGSAQAVMAGLADPRCQILSQDAGGITIRYQTGPYSIDSLEIEGKSCQKVGLPGVFLPRDAGSPDLPCISRFLAVPRGATPRVTILRSRTERRTGIEVSPAPTIPKLTSGGRPEYRWNPAVYERDALYPGSPVQLSANRRMRGVDCAILGITPFQYNPVRKELVVTTSLDLRIDFDRGTGVFGEERLRSRFWEPILETHLLNYESLPPAGFERGLDPPLGEQAGCEFAILCPDRPEFIAWADTLKEWRTLQGISTEVFTTAEIGTSAHAIRAWLHDAYDTWDVPPAAFLILGDVPGTGLVEDGIPAPIWNGYCVSDNIYADADGDDLPDMVAGRMAARNGIELMSMIRKMLTYERAPVTNPAFYDHPVIAAGWDEQSWFVLSTETIYGHQSGVLGKHPIREYGIVEGIPGDVWSLGPNIDVVVDYFGPEGLGYIPWTPEHLTDWGGSALRINADINNGAYLVVHHDHGQESGWQCPRYLTSDLTALHNNQLPFVLSINCLTGKYNWSQTCFAEAIHRMSFGALGCIAASEVSYMFVNDCLCWGILDCLWPDFLPDYGPYPPQHRMSSELRPGFGLASAKYFVEGSSWPFNVEAKVLTNHVFHHHGDPFLTLFSEIPGSLSVVHADEAYLGSHGFTIQADEGSLIGLTVDGRLVGTAEATGLPQEVAITPEDEPGQLRITVTRANAYRYDRSIPLVPPDTASLVFDQCVIDDAYAGADQDGILDAGEAVNVRLTVENVGLQAATHVAGTLSIADPYIEVLAGEQVFPDIPPGGTGTCILPYRIRVAGTIPDAHRIGPRLQARADEGTWDCDFILSAQAPLLADDRMVINDDVPLGNANGVPDAGESFWLQLRIANQGHASTGDVTSTLTSTSPYAVVEDADGECPSVSEGGFGLLGSFILRVLPECPVPADLPLRFAVNTACGHQAVLDVDLAIGPWTDDAETDRGWFLSDIGDTAYRGLWIRDEPVGTRPHGTQGQQEYDHTPDPGTLCFLTGNAEVGDPPEYEDVDGGRTTLRTPVFHLSRAVAATFRYWRVYNNDLGSNPGEDWWNVDVTSDGTNWVHLEHTQGSSHLWHEFVFDLEDYVPLTDSVQVRFVADDSGLESLVEASVDDVQLLASYLPPTGVEQAEAVEAEGILDFHPNPATGVMHVTYRTSGKGEVTIELHDVQGRVVARLLDRVVEPGTHTIPVDRGPLSSGIYFLRMRSAGNLSIRQVSIVK